MNAGRILGFGAIVARNIVPVAGMIFLDWKADRLVVLYFLDTMVGIASILTLAFIYSKELSEGKRRTLKDAFGIAVAIPFLTGMLALVLGLPVLAISGFSFDHLLALDDTQFRLGLLVQLLMACVDFFRGAWQLRGREDSDALLKSRFGFVMLRWIVVFAVALLLPLAPVLIVAYVAASVYFEIHPPPPE